MRVSLGNAGVRPLLLFVATLGLVTAGCGLGQVENPPLVGPAETGISVQLTALPDTLNADGVSQSTVQLVLRRPGRVGLLRPGRVLHPRRGRAARTLCKLDLRGTGPDRAS